MPFLMANLRPEETGTSVNLHVYKNTDSKAKARHGPRVKAFPSKIHEGNETTVTIPLREGEAARVVGRSTLSGRSTKKVLRFVEQNWVWLTMYWYIPDFDETDLRKHLELDG